MSFFLVYFNAVSGILVFIISGITGFIPAQLESVAAPFTFKISNMLCAGFLFFSAYQYYSAFTRRYVYESITVIGGWYAACCLLNVLWFFFEYRHRERLSLIVCALLCLCLLTLYLRLYCGNLDFTVPQKLFIKAPISLYLCWTLAVLVMNLMLFNPGTGWTVAMFSALTFLTCSALVLHADFVFAATAVWFLTGIAAVRGQNPVLELICLVCAAIIIIFGIAKFFDRRIKQKKYHEAKIEFF